MARSLLLACLLVVVLTSCSFCWGYTPLKVGLSLSITGNTSRTALGKTVYDGMQFFFDWYAQQPDFVINGSAYRLEFDVMDDGGSLAQVQQNYQTMWDSGSYDYFMGPINSDASTLAFNILDGKTLLVHTAAAADSVSVGSESSYSILPPASNTMSVALLQAHLAGATSFAYIQENSAYQLSVCGGTASLGRSVGMGTAVCTVTVPNSLVGITAEMNETFREAVRNISQCDFDVLILCSYWPMVPLMIEEMKSIDFTPKQLLIAPIISAYDTYPDNLWVSGYIIWSDKLAFPADRFYGTPQDFSGNFSKMFGYRPDGYAAIGAAAPLYLMNAVNLSKTVAWPDVSYSMSRLDLQTFWGRVYYAADHKPLIDPPIIQWQLPPINQTIVAPLSGQANELVYPMPTWQERTSDYGWFVYWGDIVMAVLAGVAIGISLLLIVVVVIFHNRDVFRVAQPEFVLLILFGSILCYLAIYTWLYYVTDAGCAALPWLFTTGFSLMFGSLLSKTWRIHRVFNNPKLRTVQVTRWPLLFFIGLLLALTWSLLIPWTIVDPPSAKLEVPDYTRPSQDYVICHLGSVGTGFLIAILCIEGVLLVLAAFIVFQTRNVKYLLFNEAKSIGFAIYNLIIIGAVCVGVVAADLGPTASFWVRTICFLSAAALTVACLMLPKLYYLRKGTDRTTQSGNSFSVRDSHRTTKSSDISLSDTTMNDPSDQVALLQQEIERLRREVQTLRSQQASP